MNPDRPDSPREEPERRLDVEAAFADIVAHYGDRAVLEDGSADLPQTDHEPEAGREEQPPEPDGRAAVRPAEPPEPVVRPGLFRPSWSDMLDDDATYDDEGHFVPPPPPPLPVVEPGRRLAWAGLFGAPLLMLVLLVLQVTAPSLVVGALALSFVGGFVYLVATMRADDDRDDGAVV